MSNIKNIKGTVLEIQRMSTEDGPGLRTTVFLKGCSLNCSWCHNPESIRTKPEIQWLDIDCIGCGTCVEVCENNALSLSQESIEIDRNLCSGCGICTEECPSTAMELIGVSWTADKLVNELAKDKAFFDKSGGGVTVSGGEVTMQSDFSRELLKGLKKQKINTAIDTCGHCSKAALEKLLPYANIVLFDLKEIDPVKHKEFTGKSNEIILENLKFVSESIILNKNLDQKLWVRTPVIPNATMSEENICGLGKFIGENLNGTLTRWELCTFNNLCKDKYLRLNLDWKHKDEELIKTEDIERLSKIAKTTGINAELIHWSGSTRS